MISDPCYPDEGQEKDEGGVPTLHEHGYRELAQGILRRKARHFSDKARALTGLADILDARQEMLGPDTEDSLEPQLWNLFIHGWDD